MTWQSRDATKQRQRHTKVNGRSDVPSQSDTNEHTLPPWQRQPSPPQPQGVEPSTLPTRERETWWMNEQESQHDTYTLEDERILQAEGIWSDRQWNHFARLCRRGITDL